MLLILNVVSGLVHSIFRFTGLIISESDNFSKGIVLAASPLSLNFQSIFLIDFRYSLNVILIRYFLLLLFLSQTFEIVFAVVLVINFI